MGFSFVAILVGCLCIADKNYFVNALAENDKGTCSFPCLMQNRVYVKIEDPSGTQRVHNSTDPTKITFLINGTETVKPEKCIMRSGPFFMTRQAIEANETHGMYRCSKFMLNDQTGDIMTMYITDPAVHEDIPSICNICNINIPVTPFVIKDVNVDCGVVQIPEFGCNTPLTCSVMDSTIQSQCSCAQEIFDSGDCCQ